MTDIEQQARKEAEALLALVKKYRPITDECPRCDGMGCSGPCPPHYWEAPMLEGFATFISEHSKPSLMVGFSEEEADGWRYKTPHGWVVTKTKTSSDSQPLFANTRAVSIDKIMEVVRETTWINDVDLLRERLMKIRP